MVLRNWLDYSQRCFFCVDDSSGYKVYDMNKNVVEYKNVLLIN